ncbi:MAG TPA: ribosomal protein S18-alanine N-acetyltransferase [Chloroflexota bacterium]|nr:ribosomal protein S18-alanine N-acetyltransferase [Chloroflexota bacterium]
MATTSSTFFVDRMTVADISEVIEIERQSFSLPWPPNAYKRELQDNRTAHYIVVRRHQPGQPPPPPPPRQEEHRGLFGFLKGLAPAPPSTTRQGPPTIYGYAGLWLMVDEAHITTIAVRPDYRGKGLGELVLCGLVDTSLEVAARIMTLEVRISNTVAQNLYLKYGFKQSGLRRRYYSDNNEDALIMTAENISSPVFLNNYKLLRNSLLRKLE